MSNPTSDQGTHVVTESAHGATRYKLAGEDHWTRDAAQAERLTREAAAEQAARLNALHAAEAHWCSYGTRKAP